jgi:hypothetical protein
VTLAALLWTLSAAPAPPPDTTPEPVAYRIDARLDERSHRLSGWERIEFRNPVGGQVTRLYLHLFPNAFRDARTAYAREHARLPWSSNPLDWIPWGARRGFITIPWVRIGGRDAAFMVHETTMEVPLEQSLGPGEALTIEIAFEVKLPVLQLALGFRGGSYAMALWFPKLAVPDTNGWRGDRAPEEDAFYADCGSYDVRLTTARDLVLAATGLEVATADNGDGTTTRRWLARQVRYFAWVADRRYRVRHVAWNGVAVDYLHLGRDDRSLERGLETIRAALDTYSTRYGPYPHRTLVIAETPALGSGIGGITYSQLVMLPTGLRHSALPGFSYQQVLAHEIAHQWWGMTVGVGDDRDDWLNEGLAEFSAWDLERDRRASPAGAGLRGAEYLNQAGLGFDGPIVRPDSAFDSMADREVALYAKAPFVLRMLQHLVGRDTLDAVLRRYAARYRYRAARTADLLVLADSVSGLHLGWFFSEWLDSAATCDYAIQGVAATPRPDGRFRTVIRVERQGSVVMPVEVEVTLEDGSVLRRAWTGRERSYDIVIDSAPRVRRAVVDPDRYLEETNRFNNLYPRQVGSSFLPRVPDEDAYHIVYLPLAFYQGGLELGWLLAGGRAPRLIPPTWVQPQHLAVAAVGYNVATATAGMFLAYSSPLEFLGHRASWSASAMRDRGREGARLSARALFGPHLYRAPFHMFGATLARERRFETTAEFDQGTLTTVTMDYSLRGLVTDFYPLRGGMLALAVEGGWKGFGSDWTYLRAAGRAEAYRRVLGGMKLAISAFAGSIAAGAAPRQRMLSLSRDGNFRSAVFDTVTGGHLTAANGELRLPLGTGTLLGIAGFVSLAKYWGAGPEAAGGVRREAGIGLRLFDNASYGVQLDMPFWNAGGGATGRLNFDRLSLRIGRPFRGPGS